MPVALRAGGMTEDTLVLQQKLATRTERRGFTSNKSDTAEKDQERGEGPHGCARGLSHGSEKNKQTARTPLQRRSVRAAGTLADRYGAL